MKNVFIGLNGIFMLIDRRYLRYFDWISFFLMLILCSIGLVFVLSATYTPEQPYSHFFKKQLVGVITGLVIYFICCGTNFKTLMRWGYFAYFVIIAILLFTTIKGSIGMGAQRWINLGIIKVQPSELAKLLFPAYAAYYFYTESDTLSFSTQQFMPVIIMLLISVILILKQPDLGTALVLLFSGMILLWLAGLSRKFFLCLFAITLLTAPLSWKMLKPYQKKRVLVFMGYGDSKKERYQIEQSQIAIGSGGLVGKGLLKGTQNKLSFLPEGRTDFIFSVLAEETGLFGALLVIILFFLLYIRLAFVAHSMKSPFAQILALGLMIHIMLSTFINIGMTTGLLPIVGIPLPLISYGVSNLWVTFASLGWFNGMAISRFYVGEWD